MAFATTQTLDNVLLRNISFRTTANNAISSTYGLYANGHGQTYWSNTVSPANLSTLSTSIAIAVIGLSTTMSTTLANTNENLSSLVSTNNVQYTQIATLNFALQSSVTSLTRIDQTLSNSVTSLTNNFFVLSNSLAVRVDNVYNSTVQWVESTLYGFSSFSTFYVEIGAVQSSVNTSVSSLSTALYLQNNSTYGALTLNYIAADTLLAISTINYVNRQISSLSSVIATGANLSTFSSIITSQLLSTSAGNNSRFISSVGVITSTLSTIYNSSILQLESTNVTNTSNISTLLNLSTQLSTISYGWISSFVSTSDYYQNLAINGSISVLSSSVDSLWDSSILLENAFSTISSIYSIDYGNQQIINLDIWSNISDLQYEFSIITTSSILAGIYDTFVELEYYASTLINSTILTTNTFQSTLYYSTTVQNESISRFYFNFYVSTLYTSTLSTLIPSTMSYTSTLITTLYSTGNAYLYSTLFSTTEGLTVDFISTTSSLTTTILTSTQTYLNSSIVGYVSTPMVGALSTFSTLGYVQLSTFSTLGGRQLSTQNSLFTALYISTGALYISSVNIYNSISSLYSTSVVQSGTIFSSFSTQFYGQLSTQNGLFSSTIASYPAQLAAAVNSTNTSVLATTNLLANATLAEIEASTLAAYNIYATSLLAASSTIGMSSLYTAQTINLTGSTFTGTMNMGAYRNFYINVYNLSNGLSDYTVNYTSNILSLMDYRRGVITINISTVGQAYSNNNSLLHFNVYRWGIPTTIFGNLYPFISNADYMLQYEYTIINRIVYTNLLNVFPRLAVLNPQISSIVRNVESNGTLTSNCFWRGTPVLVSWSNYNFSPYSTLGAPNLNPEVQVDVVVGGSTVAQYFSPFSQSSITIQAPYLTNQLLPMISTFVNTYIVGNSTDIATTTFNTMLPTFDSISAYSPGYPSATGFVGGQELVAITDANRYPLSGIVPNVYRVSPFNYPSFDNDPQYSASNFTNGLLNSAGARGYTPSTILVGPSNVAGQFQETSATNGYADFYVNLPTYFEPLQTLQAFNSQITFTISSATNSYTFVGSNITQVSGGLYRIFNTGVPKASNTFTSGSASIRYKYSPVSAISSFTGFTESSFVGPVFAGNPDPAVITEITNTGLTILKDPVSTVTFYNLIGGPITSNETAGMRLQGTVVFGGVNYSSTFLTTNTTSAQVFRF